MLFNLSLVDLPLFTTRSFPTEDMELSLTTGNLSFFAGVAFTYGMLKVSKYPGPEGQALGLPL